MSSVEDRPQEGPVHGLAINSEKSNSAQGMGKKQAAEQKRLRFQTQMCATKELCDLVQVTGHK